MKIKFKNWLVIGMATVSFNLLCGCQAMDAEIHHSKLHVYSKMSTPVFLDQLNTSGKNIYVRVINTSTQSLGDLPFEIKGRLSDGGYKIVNKPKQADYLLQVDVLQFGKVKMKELDKLYKQDQNYGQSGGNALYGAGTGLAIGDAVGGTDTGLAGAAGGGIVAGVGSWLLNEYVENETYSLITNIHIDEIKNGRVIKKYNTQIASTADKVDLKFDEAKPVLSDEISKEIAAIFANNN